MDQEDADSLFDDDEIEDETVTLGESLAAAGESFDYTAPSLANSGLEILEGDNGQVLGVTSCADTKKGSRRRRGYNVNSLCSTDDPRCVRCGHDVDIS